MAKRTRPAEAEMASVMLEAFPNESAALLEIADPPETMAALERERFEVLISVLSRMTPDRMAGILRVVSPERAARILGALGPNRAAAVLSRLEEDERERALAAVEADLAIELRGLGVYPPDSAGGLMDPRVTTFRPTATGRDVVRRLRGLRTRRVPDIFLVDEEGKLVGAVPLPEVVLAEPTARLEGLARQPPVSIRATESRTAAIQTFEEHRLASLPVVDFEGHLVGVLRQRELIQAAQESATASAVRMVGASEDERALSSPLFVVRKRLLWLEVNLLTAFFAAAVVGVFEDTIARVTALAVLLPVVAGQSGNTGAQALAVTMRGLALREIRTRHWLRVVSKELVAGGANGAAVALPTMAAVYLWSGSQGIAAVVGVSMVMSMTLAGAAGAIVPMVLTALRLDPAQSSSIILTTVTDVVGFFSFLGIATMLIAFL